MKRALSFCMYSIEYKTYLSTGVEEDTDYIQIKQKFSVGQKLENERLIALDFPLWLKSSRKLYLYIELLAGRRIRQYYQGDFPTWSI